MASFLPQMYWIIFALLAGIIVMCMVYIYFGVLFDRLSGESMKLPPVFNVIFIFVASAALTCAICAGWAPENIQHNNFAINDANTSIPPEVADKIFMKAFDSLPVEAKYRILSSGQK